MARFMKCYRGLGLMLLLGLALFAPARGATVALAPAPRVEPAVVGADERITITLPPQFTTTARARLGLFESGRPESVAEVRREFALVNGVRQITLRVQAEPGAYELRVLRDDKTRLPLSEAAPLLVPGVRREAGWWLLNGSPFFREATAIPEAKAAPLFLTDLRRAGKNTARNIYAPSELVWKTLPLPSLDALAAPAFDWTQQRAILQSLLSEKVASGDVGFLGFIVAPHEPNGNVAPPTPQTLASTFTRLRALIEAVAPGAALIFQNNHGSLEQSARDLEIYGATNCDAILLRDVVAARPAPQNIWLVKVARRLAEEQKNFDLPIFLQVSAPDDVAAAPGSEVQAAELDAWMSGITGVIDEAPPAWSHIVTRNLALFVGSVTLEDIGVLPASHFSASTLRVDKQPTLDFYGVLRQVGRVPLPARSGERDESYLLTPGTPLDVATLRAVRDAARSGARVYLEGAPPAEVEAVQLWSEITGAQLERLAAPASTLMTLDDIWTFGTLHSQRVPLRQSVRVRWKTPNAADAPTPKKDARKPQKGLDVLTEPRVLASLPDGSPAVAISPVGRGEVVWSAQEIFTVPGSDAARDYYAAIAAYIQPALTEIHLAPVGDSVGDEDAPRAAKTTLPVRVALRRSSRGSLLVGLINLSSVETRLTLDTFSGGEVVLDLASEKELAAKKSGLNVQVELTLAPHAWKLLAFSATRRALDEERFKPLRRAKLR